MTAAASLLLARFASHRSTSAHASHSRAIDAIAPILADSDASGCQPEMFRNGPAHQMTAATSRKRVDSLSVPFSNDIMACTTGPGYAPGTWVISTRRLRARFSGSDGGSYLGLSDPTPVAVRRAGLSMVRRNTSTTLAARSRDNSALFA